MSNKKTVTTKKASNEGMEKVKKFFIKLKDIVLNFLKKHWDILLINLIVFILTVFVEPLFFDYTLRFFGILTAFAFILIPTALISLKRNIKTKNVLISLPVLYILFLIFLDYCTTRELYGINNLGIDTFPNYIDALMVVFIFTFAEYLVIYIINKLKNNKKETKTTKKIETKKKIKK